MGSARAPAFPGVPRAPVSLFIPLPAFQGPRGGWEVAPGGRRTKPQEAAPLASGSRNG